MEDIRHEIQQLQLKLKAYKMHKCDSKSFLLDDNYVNCKTENPFYQAFYESSDEYELYPRR